MKKIILQVLAVLLLLCIPLSAFAAGTTASADRAVPGGSVTLRFELPERYENVTAGAVSFTFDDRVFELTDAKWLLSGTLLKDINTETCRGVFQFNSPKSVEGEALELTFQISEDARSASYTFETEFQFSISGQEERIYVDPAMVIYVYETPSEDTETDVSAADFITKASSITSSAADEATYQAVVEALTVYEQLDDVEKTAVSATYQDLIVKVESYNAAVTVANDAAEEASSVAFSAMARAFSFLSELFEVFKTHVWVLG